jgi:hypothetical protein
MGMAGPGMRALSNHRIASGFLCCVSLMPSAGARQVEALDEQELDFFERSVRPILVENCLECHGTSRKRPRGGLRLDHRDGWALGGDQGAAIVPGDPIVYALPQMLR